MNMDVMRQLVAEAELGARDMSTAHAALAHWVFDAGSLKDLRYSANAIYVFKQVGSPRILRLVHAGDGICGRTCQHIQAELDFVQYLGQLGIRAMQPLPSVSGTYVETVINAYAQFHASVFEMAPGDLLLDMETLNDAQIIAWGRTVAEVHKATEVYQAPVGRRRPTWHDIIDMMAAWLPPHERDARRFLEEAEAWLSTLPSGPEDYGLIHWDFCLDNLSWHEDGNAIGHYHIFDFDDTAYFWYVADLAFGLAEVLELPPPQRDHIMETFLAGYCSIRPCLEAWLETIPRFINFMHLFKVARVMYALAPAAPDLDPDWMAKLRFKFERWFAEMRALFVQPF